MVERKTADKPMTASDFIAAGLFSDVLLLGALPPTLVAAAVLLL
jgi:hypothetical protein